MATSAKRLRKDRRPSSVLVGENVYRIRVMRAPKMSQRALANLSGVAMETVRKLEQNREPGRDQLSVQFQTLDKIAAALGVDPDELLKETATPSSPAGKRDHLKVIRTAAAVLALLLL